MRTRIGVLKVVSALALGPAPALCADGTWVVVPGRRDVPVFVNPYGLDASYTVVEGDFGLDRPGQVNPHIVAGPRVVPLLPPIKHYFPGLSGTPGVVEAAPPPAPFKPPKPAESYSRSWSTQSDPLPASTDPPYPISVDAYTGPGGPWGPWPGPRGPKGPKGLKPKPLKPGGH